MMLLMPAPAPREMVVRPLPALLKVAMSVATGTAAGDQFPAVAQLVLVAPVQVVLAAWVKPGARQSNSAMQKT